MKSRKKAKKLLPRSGSALAAKMRSAGTLHDRRVARGNARSQAKLEIVRESE